MLSTCIIAQISRLLNTRIICFVRKLKKKLKLFFFKNSNFQADFASWKKKLNNFLYMKTSLKKIIDQYAKSDLKKDLVKTSNVFRYELDNLENGSFRKF